MDKLGAAVNYHDKSMAIVDEWFGHSSDNKPSDICTKEVVSNFALSDSKLLKKNQKSTGMNKKRPSLEVANEEDCEESRTSVVRSTSTKKSTNNVENIHVAANSKQDSGPKAKLNDVAVKTNRELDTLKSDDNKQVDGYKRKRKKTRSKQKNIRRDNRDELAKPEHLQYASDNYAGRSLSEVSL